MFKKIYKFATTLVLYVRMWLNELREKSPQKFDKAVKICTFLIPFVSCFAPALVTNNWLRAILEFFVLSVILVFQWSTFTNRLVEKDKELTMLNDLVKSQAERIESLEADEDVYTKWIGDDGEKYNNNLNILNMQFDYYAGFSHSMSDNVKKIIAEIQKPVDVRVTTRMTLFFQESLNSLEKVLTDFYKIKIRASLKITINNDKVKTYARGANNIESRGGQYHCYELNEKEINVSENYAYIAIVQRGQKFFSEGDLLKMHNKFKPDDKFFCEYGEDYINIFGSTVVMPIRIPVYNRVTKRKHKPIQEVLGLLCIDCESVLPEWSEVNFKDFRAYHIIANYADSLALLVKEFRDASREKQKTE